jgi:hypothetical protein
MKNSRIWIILLIFIAILLGTGICYGGNTGYIDSHNRFILNGEPFFPIGLYVVQCANGSYIDQLDEIADSPFDTVMNYGISACGGTDAEFEQIRGYLDALQSRNLRVIFSLAEYFSACFSVYEQCDDPDALSTTRDIISQKVTGHRDHEAVIAWYMNDEICPDCLQQLEEGYELITGLDSDHPIWSVHWNTNWLLPEAHTTDIVGVDSYPIDHGPITWVAQGADAAIATGKPLWFVPQIFSWTDYPWDFRAATGRPPTREEIRAMTYLAVNHGAKGLIYYSYFDIRNDEDYDERWPEIKAIAGEIRDLRHVFLATYQTNENDVTCDNADIDFKLMREGGIYYLLAVNTSEQVVAGIPFNVSLPNQPWTVGVLFEDREIAADNGYFTDDFAPYEVHVYQWRANCCAGDFNGSGDVGVSDLGILAPGYGRADCNDVSGCEGDSDGDQDIDGSDLAALAADFAIKYCPVCED